MFLSLTLFMAVAGTTITTTTSAFAPSTHPSFRTNNVAAQKHQQPLYGYLDDLSKELYAPSDDGEVLDREGKNLDKKDVDRYSVGNWEGYVDFHEFDGGDVSEHGVIYHCYDIVS
jgi:hypothetical protein